MRPARAGFTHRFDRRIATVILLFAAPLSLGNASEASAENGRAVLVLPYQSIFRSVAQPKVARATEFLLTELSRTEGLRVIRGGVARNETGTASIASAEALTDTAVEAERTKNIDVAIATHRKAVAEFELNAAALSNAIPYANALHRLARALMWSGADAEAQKVIERAARLRPELKLPASEYSRAYRRWFDAAARKVVNDAPGKIKVTSPLVGTVSLDGQRMGTAPIVINTVVPGEHLVSVEAPDVPRFGRIVRVPSGRTLEVLAEFKTMVGGPDIGAVTEAITDNEISSEAVQKAAAAGRRVGAKFVVVGGMTQDPLEAYLTVYTGVVRVSDAVVKALDPVKLDGEMLTIESDILNIVEQVTDSVLRFSGGAIAIDRLQPKTDGFDKRILSRANGAPPPLDARTAGIDDGGRQVFRAVKDTTIQIREDD